MNEYTALNLGLLIILVSILAVARPTRVYFIFVLRVSILMLLMVYPWDYFGIHQESWSYPHPQPRLFLVPLNDIAFMLQCNLLALVVFKPVLEPLLTLNIQSYAKAASKKRENRKRGIP